MSLHAISSVMMIIFGLQGFSSFERSDTEALYELDKNSFNSELAQKIIVNSAADI
jgi:hypothetical protein